MKKFISTIGESAAWLSLVLVLLICFDVAFRYIFQDTQVWMIELEWYIFGFLILFCGGWSWLEERHVRVDVFYQRYPGQIKKTVDRLGHMLLAIPWLLIVIYASFQYAGYALRWNEGSPDPGGLPARYIIKYAITIGFILMLLALIVKLKSDSKVDEKS